MEKFFIIYVIFRLNAAKRASLVSLVNDDQTHPQRLNSQGVKGDLPSGKLNLKTGPPPVDILIFSIL